MLHRMHDPGERAAAKVALRTGHSNADHMYMQQSYHEELDCHGTGMKSRAESLKHFKDEAEWLELVSSIVFSACISLSLVLHTQRMHSIHSHTHTHSLSLTHNAVAERAQKRSLDERSLRESEVVGSFFVEFGSLQCSNLSCQINCGRNSPSDWAC